MRCDKGTEKETIIYHRDMQKAKILFGVKLVASIGGVRSSRTMGRWGTSEKNEQ
ncbi:hypothetical protein ANBU17_31790 [Anaerostipes butyraticus]|uniref:Uncharacterized protein n=1 Tax=Anaerostipes butyraticus TaxID=645466 RepID=A0A916Q9J5_9FIRM|nr:hypothetical protein ANBU17_31790 [Anaerostipes butyraticus]